MLWDELTSSAIEALDRDIPVLLPVAATEQHGPHLPLATDRMIGWHFAYQLHLKIPDQILILPPVAVGCSSHHMDFSGTLSVSHEAFAAYVEEILESVIAHDFNNLIIFNSHGGNQGIGQVILERLGPEVGQLVLVTWWKLALEALIKINETGPGGVGHAGEFETSLMMYIAPHLVDEKAIAKGENQETYGWATADMLRGAKAGLYRSMYEMTPNGVFGDPTKSNAKKGEQISNLVVQSLKFLVLDLLNGNKN
ncbi:MAG: creatininase family protein [Saprospiraceae bacterium]|nr:creatininase family protein [Saprospiraceae bacterium]